MAIFPEPFSSSIVAASRLYGRIRYGNGCFPTACTPNTNYLIREIGFCQKKRPLLKKVYFYLCL